MQSDPNPALAAVRHDPQTGQTEEARFFGSHHEQLFGYTHLPAGTPTLGVVICSPIEAEVLQNSRREVLLGRALAGAGCAVQRFHYRGQGSSDGDGASTTFETLVEDARDAAAYLTRRAGVSDLVFLGTRLGANAAASAATGNSAALVLWEPVVSGAAYMRDIFRAQLVRNAKRGERDGASREGLAEELQRTGALDILGFTIHRQLHESVQAMSLEGVLGTGPRTALLVQMGGGPDLRAGYAKAKVAFETAGGRVEVHITNKAEVWWFQGGRFTAEEANALGQDLVATTVAFVRELSRTPSTAADREQSA